jgi:predicted RecB family nuclease
LPVNLNPKIHTKYINYDTPDFKRYVARDSIKEEQAVTEGRRKLSYEKKPMPDYNPNKEATQRSLALGAVHF